MCPNCSRLAQLYHRLAHQKHRMFAMCSEVVETRRKSASNFDTTKLLNELLANDKWLEQVLIALHVGRGLSGPSPCSWLLHFFKPFLSSSPSDQVTFGPSNSWCVCLRVFAYILFPSFPIFVAIPEDARYMGRCRHFHQMMSWSGG